MSGHLERLLVQVADGYRHAHTDLYTLPSSPPAPGSRGKPNSRPPAGAAVHIRSSLVTCARRIADAHDRAGGTSRPTWPGFNSRLGWRTGVRTAAAPGDRDGLTDIATIVHRDQTVQLVVHPSWHPSPGDVILTPPPPESVRGACNAIAGLAAVLHLGSPEHATVEGLVRLAHGQVRNAGGFPDEARRHQHYEVQRLLEERCADCGAATEPGKRGHGRCKGCLNRKQYRERKGRTDSVHA